MQGISFLLHFILITYCRYSIFKFVQYMVVKVSYIWAGNIRLLFTSNCVIGKWQMAKALKESPEIVVATPVIQFYIITALELYINKYVIGTLD